VLTHYAGWRIVAAIRSRRPQGPKARVRGRKIRGANVDAIRPVEQRRPDRGLRDGGSEAGAQWALGGCGGCARAI